MIAKMLVFALVSFVLFAAIRMAEARDRSTRPAYPPTRVAPVTETIHGVDISDAYRWLESTDSAEVRTWIDAQNRFMRAILDKIPGREAMHRRLTDLLSVGSISTPVVRGHRYFYSKRDGQQNQPVVYLRDGLRAEPRGLIDTNT